MSIYIELYTAYGKDEKKYYVEIYTQPRWRHLLWHLYHAYDMGFARLANRVPPLRWLGRQSFGKRNRFTSTKGRRRDPETGEMVPTNEPFEWSQPWFASQDLRCYELSHKGRKRIQRFEITETEYEALQGHE